MCFRKAAGVVPLLQGFTKVQIATHSQFAAEMDSPAGLLASSYGSFSPDCEQILPVIIFSTRWF